MAGIVAGAPDGQVAVDMHVQKVLQAVYKDGYDAGFAAGKAAGRKAGFKEGIAKARKALAGLPLPGDEAPASTESSVPAGGEKVKELSVYSPIRDLELSSRVYDRLVTEGFHTIASLATVTANELLRDIMHFGPKALEEVRTRLAAYGYSLHGEPNPHCGDQEESTTTNYYGGSEEE